MSLACKLVVFEAVVQDPNLFKILKGKIDEVTVFKLNGAKIS